MTGFAIYVNDLKQILNVAHELTQTHFFFFFSNNAHLTITTDNNRVNP